MQMICPKCQGVMRSYERNGVTIDQCSECRGLFLDRGELERLVDAENAWHDQRRPKEQAPYPPTVVSGPDPRYAERRYDHDDDDRHHGDRHHYEQGHYKKKKQRGFLEDLFE